MWCSSGTSTPSPYANIGRSVDVRVTDTTPELLERRYDATATVFCTQYAKNDWHQRLGSGVHADAIMDRIVHNTLWI